MNLTGSKVSKVINASKSEMKTRRNLNNPNDTNPLTHENPKPFNNMMNTTLGLRNRTSSTFQESLAPVKYARKRTFFDPEVAPLTRLGLPHIHNSNTLELSYDPKSAKSIPTKRNYLRQKLYLKGHPQTITSQKYSLTFPKISTGVNNSFTEEEEPIKKVLIRKFQRGEIYSKNKEYDFKEKKQMVKLIESLSVRPISTSLSCFRP